MRVAGYFNSKYYHLDKSLVAIIYFIKQSAVSRTQGKNLYTLRDLFRSLFEASWSNCVLALFTL